MASSPGRDRNGEIFDAATLPPIEVNRQNETESGCHQHASFPLLSLCSASGATYTAATNQLAAQRASSAAASFGTMFGVIMSLSGLVPLIIGIAFRVHGWPLAGPSVPLLAIGGFIVVAGIVMVSRAKAKGRRASWLQTNGLALVARVVDAQLTGTRINYVPVYRLVLQVAGPRGPYTASITKLMAEHQVAQVLGQELRVRANPNNLGEVIFES